MGRLIVSMMTSIDGYIEGPGRELDWTVDSPDFDSYCIDMLDSADTLLFGRVSYQMMVEYWPAAEIKPKSETERALARKMNELPKVVLSRSLTGPAWNNTRVVGNNVREEVAALKQRAVKDCFVFGGAGIISTLRRLELIDEYRVIVHPVVLGRGTPLFTDVAERFPLRPLRAQPLDSGVVIHYYAAR
jgi:dihydrofolate reductase